MSKVLTLPYWMSTAVVSMFTMPVVYEKHQVRILGFMIFKVKPAWKKLDF